MSPGEAPLGAGDALAAEAGDAAYGKKDAWAVRGERRLRLKLATGDSLGIGCV